MLKAKSVLLGSATGLALVLLASSAVADLPPPPGKGCAVTAVGDAGANAGLAALVLGLIGAAAARRRTTGVRR